MSKSVTIECQACSATGLERIGRSSQALVCSFCKGNGSLRFAYTPFTSRANKQGIRRVFPYTGRVVTPEIESELDLRLGSLSYSDWQALPADAQNLLVASDPEAIGVLMKLRGPDPLGRSLYAGAISHRIVCEPCQGTGLVVGEMEREGAAVPCILCFGSGAILVGYNAFEKRLPMHGITHVFPYTAGAAFRRSGTSATGTPYAVWQSEGCSRGDEPRDCMCPVEIYGEDVLLFGKTGMKADTDWCLQVQPAIQRWGRAITQCPAFASKSVCWQAFDTSDDTHRNATLACLKQGIGEYK